MLFLNLNGLFISQKFLKKQRQNNIGLYSAVKLERKLVQNYICDRSLNIFIFRFPNCDPCDPSLGSLENISPAQIYRADLTSVVFFFLSFVAIYFVNETYISSFQSFQILFFSVFLFLSYNFPIFYFLSFSSVFLCISPTFYFCLYLSVFYFLSCCLLLFSSDFLCLSSNFSFCFYLFLCLLLSFLAFFYFHSLQVFYDIPLTLLFILLHICVCVFFYYHYYYHLYPPVLLFCIFYLSVFCLPFLLIFLLFSFSFMPLIWLFCPLSLIILC